MSGDAPFSSSTPAHISLPFFVAAKSAVIPSLFRPSKDTLKCNKTLKYIHGVIKLYSIRLYFPFDERLWQNDFFVCMLYMIEHGLDKVFGGPNTDRVTLAWEVGFNLVRAR